MCMLTHSSHVRLFVTLWMVACQAPLSMRFSRQKYWSGLPFPPPGDLPDPMIEHESLMSPVLAGRFFNTSDTWEAPIYIYIYWILHNGLDGKESACSAGGLGLISWVPQDNSMGRGAWGYSPWGCKESDMTE